MSDELKEFGEHVGEITKLVCAIEDYGVQVRLLEAIEMLIQGLNGPWHGQVAVWQWFEIPDTPAALFDED